MDKHKSSTARNSMFAYKGSISLCVGIVACLVFLAGCTTIIAEYEGNRFLYRSAFEDKKFSGFEMEKDLSGSSVMRITGYEKAVNPEALEKINQGLSLIVQGLAEGTVKGIKG